MVVRLGCLFERDLNDLLQAAGKRGREYARADDDPGVAVARLLAGSPRRSTSATDNPRLTRCSATDVPTMPAPRTIASVRAMRLPKTERSVPRRLRPAPSTSIPIGARGSRYRLRPSMADMSHALRPLRAVQPSDRRGRACSFSPRAGAWLGRQGTRAVAASLFIGIVLPPLAALLKPLFVFALFAVLCLAFLRVDPAEVRPASSGHVAASPPPPAWMMLATPMLIALTLLVLGLSERLPGLYVAMILQAAGPPLTSAPALAALMGLDAALSLATWSSARRSSRSPRRLSPRCSSAAEHRALAVTRSARKLLACSQAPRSSPRWCGGSRVSRGSTPRMDAYRRASSVIALFVFAGRLMDGVLGASLHDPAARCSADGAFLLALARSGCAHDAFVFARLGLAQALALGLAAGNRNMGVMLAAAGAAVPELTWLYFAISQFPIYLLPAMLKPLARSSRRRLRLTVRRSRASDRRERRGRRSRHLLDHLRLHLDQLLEQILLRAVRAARAGAV